MAVASGTLIIAGVATTAFAIQNGGGDDSVRIEDRGDVQVGHFDGVHPMEGWTQEQIVERARRADPLMPGIERE